MNFDEVYKIGKIGKPHGVKGEVSFLFDDDVFDRTEVDYLVLCIDGILVPFFIDEYRFHGNASALVKFADIDTQEAARELTGCEVYFPRHLADEAGDALSWAQIVGFSLTDTATQTKVGTIQAVDDQTVNVLFEVVADDGRQLLIPLHEELIVYVDADRHDIGMNLPEGLLDL